MSRSDEPRAEGVPAWHPAGDPPTPLDCLKPGARGVVVRITRDVSGRRDRLAALGVTRGATIRVLQTFPGIVFECDQTEIAIERAVARTILVK
jgi:Fe2+ transport system protein FeoA